MPLKCFKAIRLHSIDSWVKRFVHTQQNWIFAAHQSSSKIRSHLDNCLLLGPHYKSHQVLPKKGQFLSPPVHFARWAHMRRFLSVCLGVLRAHYPHLSHSMSFERVINAYVFHTCKSKGGLTANVKLHFLTSDLVT